MLLSDTCMLLHTDIDLKKASKTFAQHFSCGSAVTGEDEIVIQGDVYDDIVEYIQEKWPKASHMQPYLLGSIYTHKSTWTAAFFLSVCITGLSVLAPTTEGQAASCHWLHALSPSRSETML